MIQAKVRPSTIDELERLMEEHAELTKPTPNKEWQSDGRTKWKSPQDTYNNNWWGNRQYNVKNSRTTTRNQDSKRNGYRWNNRGPQRNPRRIEYNNQTPMLTQRQINEIKESIEREMQANDINTTNEENGRSTILLDTAANPSYV